MSNAAAVLACRATLVAVSLAAALGIAPPAFAMDVSGAVSGGVIYTDNVTLAPDGLEEDDFILRVAPSISLASLGRRYDFRLDYTLEALYYQDQPDSTEVYNQGAVTFDLEVLEEHLFLNTLATISQVVVDPEQKFSSTNVPRIGNRSDATRYQIGPEWRQDILDTSLNVRYDIGRVNYADETLQDGEFQVVNTDWTGPEPDRGLTWAIRHEYRNFDYEFSESARRQLAELSLIYRLSGGWAPFVSVGMESDVRGRTDASLEDGIWRAGLRRNTARTSFEAFAGERSFGSSWGAHFEQQYGAESGDILRVAYAEIPRTNEDLDTSLAVPAVAPGITPPPGPSVPPPVLPPEVTAPGSGRLYLEKRGDLVISRAFSQNALSLNVFYVENETLTDENLEDGNTSRQTGLTLAWVHAFGARTQAILDGYYANREFSRVNGSDGEDDIFRVRLGFNYELGTHTVLYGWVAREEQSGSESIVNNYTENQVGLSVGRTF